MKKSTLIKIAIGIIILVITGFILNPFYWLMQPKKRIEQPNLNQQESIFFNQLRNKYNCELERSYYNYNSQGNDTLREKDYNKFPFEYAISMNFIKDPHPQISEDSIYAIGLYIKNIVLNKNPNLKKIIFYKGYDSYRYIYDSKKDSLYKE